MVNDKYSDNFWTLEHFGHILDDIFGYLWTSDWTGFEKCPNLTPLVGTTYLHGIICIAQTAFMRAQI